MTTDDSNRPFAAGAAPWRHVMVVASILLGLGGCSGRQFLSVSDRDAPSVQVRAAVRPDAWARDERPGPGIEFGFERVRGSEVRRLAAGESIDIGGTVLAGPDDVDQSIVMQRAQVVYTHPLYVGGHFQLEPFVGATHLRLHYRVAPGASAARLGLDGSRTMVVGGVAPRWRFNDTLALEARLTLMPGLGANEDYYRSTELALMLSPAPAVALRLGYAERQVQMLHDSATVGTKIWGRLNGPVATLLLSF